MPQPDATAPWQRHPPVDVPRPELARRLDAVPPGGLGRSIDRNLDVADRDAAVRRAETLGLF